MSSEKQRETDICDWYVRYGDAIFKYILMMIQDYQQAEDLTQETFLKAYRFYDNFNHQSTRKTWLFSVARNSTIDYMRKRKPLQLIKEFLLFSKKDDSPLPEDAVVIKENVQELYEVLGKMKPKYKEVIILRKIKGFNIRETAEILNWSEGKVRTTLFRAMSELQTRMIKEGFPNEKTI
ncbi:RNA polymerase sigma factor [Halalkalibacter urbisdiaboli]|uniref:RNA polymerase sigma factor n=1 Tax=Halalkalibacter urbisdiaboli TaxID=1960589 RepID=UPI000B44F201|nr:sigma-70 family RNA polymerase sigma factor [Halalkalibacter urbisdiaboli]